jgi:DNA-binding NarL/FixJ family response regulator
MRGSRGDRWQELEFPLRLTYGARFKAPLTKREQDILRLRARGNDCRVISKELGITKSTTDSHLDNIATKLATRDPALLALWAVHLGYVQASEVESLGEMLWRSS